MTINIWIPNRRVRTGRNDQIIGTHTLKIRCVCTDENGVSAVRNLLKTMDTESFSRMWVISTTTLTSVSSRTDPHTPRDGLRANLSLPVRKLQELAALNISWGTIWISKVHDPFQFERSIAE
jgi:hypothetical protein